MAWRHKFVWMFSLGVVLAIGLDRAHAADALDQKPGANNITFTKDVAPLVFQHCAVCHRPGEVAPFSLLNYGDVRKHARQIADLTASRQMPPWKAVAEPGTFRGERVLSEQEISLLRKWVEGGMVQGDAKDLPAAPQFVAGWQLGEPDQIITMPRAYEVPAEGRDIYRNFVIPVEIPAGKYIRAVEYRPGNPRVVHHAAFAWDSMGKFRDLDGKDGAAGFTSVTIGGNLLPGSSGFWVPGKSSIPMPEGAAFAWPHGAEMLLQLHLHPSGKPEIEQSRIGLYFTSEPPRRQLQAVMMIVPNINIAAGEKAYRTRAEKTLTGDAQLIGIFPHMHWIGKDSKVTALLPDGSKKLVLKIDHWDFNWQGYYEFTKPILLPRGTVVVMENTHDNSDANPANPNHPARQVVGGEQTSNEMSALVFHLLPVNTPAHSAPSGSSAIAAAATRPAAAMDLEHANAALKLYDKDGDGKLSSEEMAQIPGVNVHDLPGVLQRFDKDKDGKLDAAELAEAIATMRGR